MSELTIAGKVFSSRLLTGTGKFKSNQEMGEALAASGSQLVTMALKRVDLNNSDDEILKHLNRQQFNCPISARSFRNQLGKIRNPPRSEIPHARPNRNLIGGRRIGKIGLCRFTVYSCRPSFGKKITRCRLASRHAIRVADWKQ